MGTRSLTRVIEKYDDEEVVIINMYRQYDGYPSGHGAELGEFIKDIKLVNGIGADTTKIANGMGCLAAQIVANFKTEAGGIYLEPVTAWDCGQEYEYEIRNVDDKIHIKVIDTWEKKTIFQGDTESFIVFCNEN